MEGFELSDYGDYDHNDTSISSGDPELLTFSFTSYQSVLAEGLMGVNIVICLLGICGNSVVIWVSGFRMKRTVNTTWYLSLAVSDLLFCVFLPFNIVHMATSTWPFGLAMCKLSSLVLLLNMFSSIFLLVLVSVDRCLSITLPVWSHNHRTIRKASVSVFVAWVISAALSTPALAFRQVKGHGSVTVCYNDYAGSHNTVALSRFLCGFVLPFLVIVTCYSFIINKLRNKQMTKSSKPFRVMSVLIAAFFVCWLPYHTFVLLELRRDAVSSKLVNAGLEVGSTLAAANSFLNPILYVLMGDDFRKKLKSSVYQRIERAIGEESHARGRSLSRFSSVEDGRTALAVR